MPTLEVDTLVSSLTRPQMRAMMEALVRDLYPKTLLSAAERKAADAELDRRFATRDRSVTVEEAIRLSNEPRSTRRR